MYIFGAPKMYQTSARKPMLIIKFTNIKTKKVGACAGRAFYAFCVHQ